MAAANPRASRKPSPIWLGCSGWAYPSWRPEFYPAGTPQKKLLEAYAARLNSVEVNYTFRTLPTPSIVEGWLRATTDDFRFSFKAPQRITHFSRLRDCSAHLEAFARAIQPIVDAGRIGVVLFQLPPNFQVDHALLDTFLTQAASTGLRLSFEFRHPSWFGHLPELSDKASRDAFDTTCYTLQRHRAALCIAESDGFAVPDTVTAPFVYFRFRRSEYHPLALEAVGGSLTHRAHSREVFAYFKHEEEPTGALRAAAVRAALPA